MIGMCGCVSLRQSGQGQSPVPPPPPPVVVEARPPVQVDARGSDRASGVLALAEAAMFVGLEEGADLLLADFLRSAPMEAGAHRARALVLRALVAVRRGGPDDLETAEGFLLAARQIQPMGPSAPAASMTLELLAAIEAREEDLKRTRSRLAASRRREGEEQAGAEVLRNEVESLKQQLNDLKEIHLRIESDKQDAPSR
jgi:hypothetical protein